MWYVVSSHYGSCGQYERNVTAAPLFPELAEQPLLPGHERRYRRVERLLTPKPFRYMSAAIRAVILLKRTKGSNLSFRGSLSSLVPWAYNRVEVMGSSALTTGCSWHVKFLVGLKINDIQTERVKCWSKNRSVVDDSQRYEVHAFNIAVGSLAACLADQF